MSCCAEPSRVENPADRVSEEPVAARPFQPPVAVASKPYKELPVRKDGRLEGSGHIEVVVAFVKPPRAFERSPGPNRCNEPRRPPLDIFIRDRVRPVFGVKGAFVRLVDISQGRPLPEQSGRFALERCRIWPRTAVAFPAAPVTIEQRSLERALLLLEPGPLRFPMTPIGRQFAVPLPEPGVYRLTHDQDPTDSAHLLVSPHPYATTTDDQGVARLEDIPPGTYRLEVWHPPLSPAQKPVTGEIEVQVEAKQTKTYEVSLSLESSGTPAERASVTQP
jgi:hypothetical protein